MNKDLIAVVSCLSSMSEQMNEIQLCAYEFHAFLRMSIKPDMLVFALV